MTFKEYQPVRTFAGFLERIEAVRKDWPPSEKAERRGEQENLWYRGQSFAKWELAPKLYRPEYDGADEAEIRSEFQRRALQLVERRLPSDKWEWYFLMQHYRAPTRLLDWTDNPLVALYFAVEEHQDDCDGAVWVLDPWWLNVRLGVGIGGPMFSDWDEAQPYLPELEDAFDGKEPGARGPAAIDPPHVDRRLAAQGSRFVIFGRTQKDLVKLKMRRRREQIRVAKIVVQRSSKKELEAKLADCGITHSSVFPDLEGLGKEIRRSWVKS